MSVEKPHGTFKQHALSTLGITDAEWDELIVSPGEEPLVEFVSIMESIFVRERIPAVIRAPSGERLGRRSLLEILRVDGIEPIKAAIKRLSLWVPE